MIHTNTMSSININLSSNTQLRNLFERFEQYESEEQLYSTDIEEDFLRDLVFGYLDLDHAEANDYESYSLLQLVEYLEQSHRYYKRKRFQKIEQHLVAFEKECSDPLLMHVVHRFYNHFKQEMLSHFNEEENALFPFARFIFVQQQRCNDGLVFHTNSIIDVDLSDHEQHNFELEELIKLLKAQSNKFGMKLSYRVLLNQLEDFDRDLKLHELIEDEVFIPKLKRSLFQLNTRLDILHSVI